MKDNISIQRLFIRAVAGAIVVLFTVNGFFVKRLIDEVDSTQQLVWDLRQQVAVMVVTLNNFPKHCCMDEETANGENVSKRTLSPVGTISVN